MVKRHPHIAIVTIMTGGSVVNGEWVEGSTHTVDIVGRYDIVSNLNGDVVRENANGDEMKVKGEFYTQHEKIVGAISLEIASLGIKKNIICWLDYQTHSVISV